MERIQKFNRRDLKRISIALFLFFSFWILLFLFNKANYVINTSNSLPLGIYKKYEIKNELKQGDIVLYVPSEERKRFMIERGYWGHEKYTQGLLKRIEGVEGDVFKVTETPLGLILIKNNEKNLGFVFKKDSRGRDLNNIGELVLDKEEYFLVGTTIKTYDSRYFGAVKKDRIKNIVLPVLTFKEDR